jgi:hypothetical protein
LATNERVLAKVVLHDPLEPVTHTIPTPLPESLRIFLRVTGLPQSAFSVSTTLGQAGVPPRRIDCSGETSENGIGLAVILITSAPSL